MTETLINSTNPQKADIIDNSGERTAPGPSDAAAGSDVWGDAQAAHYLACYQAEMAEWIGNRKMQTETDIALRTFAFCLGERMAGRDPNRFFCPKLEPLRYRQNVQPHP